MDVLYEDEAAPLIFRSGSPAAVRDTRKSYQKQLAVYLILASLLFERVAFYLILYYIVISLGSNISIHWQYSNTLIASFIFSGTTYVSTLIFAFISDAKLGRAKTIIIGFSVYLIGYGSFILITIPNVHKNVCATSNGTSASNTNLIFHEACAYWVLPTLIVIGIGAGAVQSNMAVLGAEQIRESKITSRYFDKFIVAVNIGGVIAKLTISFVQIGGTNYYITYIVATAMLFFAALLFIIGWRYYIHSKPYDSVITKCIPVIVSAFQTWRQYEKHTRSIVKKKKNFAASNLVNTSQSLAEEEESIRTNERPPTFLDFAKIPNHGKFADGIVDDVKSLRNAFIVFGFFIPYWLIYSQIYSSFPAQLPQLNTLPGQLVVASISLSDPVTIIIGILILNIYVYKYFDARNRTTSIAIKFVIGMIFACISMCLAGSVEIFRQNCCDNSTSLLCDNLNLSIYTQLPQNIAMGLSEVFAMVASYEYAYFAAPRSAQSLFMSLRFCSLGVSSFIGAAYTAIFSSASMELTFSCSIQDKKKWVYYSYFFILGGLQLIFIIIFIVCQKTFRIIELNLLETETDQSPQHSRTSSTNRE